MFIVQCPFTYTTLVLRLMRDRKLSKYDPGTLSRPLTVSLELGRAYSRTAYILPLMKLSAPKSQHARQMRRAKVLFCQCHLIPLLSEAISLSVAEVNFNSSSMPLCLIARQGDTVVWLAVE